MEEFATHVRDVVDTYHELAKRKGRAVAGDRGLLLRDGRRFSALIVDRLDGYIVNVYTYKKASDNRFHHVKYLNLRDLTAFKEGKVVIVWLDTVGRGMWFDLRYAEDADLPMLRERIAEQIELDPRDRISPPTAEVRVVASEQ